VRHRAIELRDSRIDRVHAAADKVANDARLAGIADAEALAHEATGPVGADEVLGPHALRLAAGRGLHLHVHAVVALFEVRHAPAVVHLHARQPLGVPAKHLLDELLVHTMRQLGSAPGPA
jgi:hypothetical protein